jgi:hypothetical protein
MNMRMLRGCGDELVQVDGVGPANKPAPRIQLLSDLAGKQLRAGSHGSLLRRSEKLGE